ncbi:MAG: glycoside hydrolase family 127 protein [Verrucomicrobiae bacterium]|nr:glycoside hydrolase family 127 protein [Verrucomicrobiae bacterium]
MLRCFLTSIALASSALAANMLPPGDVRLAAGPFLDAQQRDLAYLLELDPDRLLSGMREAAGLEPKAPRYGGWEKRGSGMVGHYLAALAWMSEVTGDPRLHERIDHIVGEMALYQETTGAGGLFSSPWERHEWFGLLARGELRLSNVVPWYTAHKTLSGLRDAWVVAGNKQAGEVLRRYADWCVEVTSKLTDEQWRGLTSKEFGAPGEVFADLWARTGDARYGDLAKRFCKTDTRDALARGDGAILTGRHANTEIPLFLGYQRIADAGGGDVWHKAAESFWRVVTREQTFVFGGNSIWECFIAPHEHEARMQRLCGPETCNSHNMLKLTRALWEKDPRPGYLDFIDNVLHNHILTTINRGEGGVFTYYTPTLPGHYRRFSHPTDAFWCCVGSGMENHARYGESIYAKEDDRFFVNVYIPSAARWPEMNATLTQSSSFPESDVRQLRWKLDAPATFTVTLRIPAWSGAPRLRVNGEDVNVAAGPAIDIRREWRDGDRIDLLLPADIRSVRTPGGGRFVSYFHGPWLLAAALGMEGLEENDLIAGGNEDFEQLGRKRVPLSHFPGVGEAAEKAVVRKPGAIYQLTSDKGPVELVPFHEVGRGRYAVYFPVR